MQTEIASILLGLALLLVAGDLLVRGAVSLARSIGVPTLLIGLTIVAFGTSAPELAVSIKAVLADDPGIAIGNIVGSNIANILLVLGVPALIWPVAASEPGVRRYATAVVAATALFCWFAYARESIDFTAGAVLFGGLALFLGYVGMRAMSGAGDPLTGEIEEFDESKRAWWLTAVFLVAGLVGLPLGGNLLVESGASHAAQSDGRAAKRTAVTGCGAGGRAPTGRARRPRAGPAWPSRRS